MKAYSSDLRERIAVACAEAGRNQRQVAAQFQVSPSFIAKLLRRQHLSGNLAAHHPGLPPPGRPSW